MNKETKKSALDSFVEAIRNSEEFGPSFKASEALEEQAKKCVFAVDLEIAFSPVLLPGCHKTEQSVEVDYRGEDGRGLIREPYTLLSEDEHKLARARFLCARGNELQPAINKFLVRKTENPL